MFCLDRKGKVAVANRAIEASANDVVAIWNCDLLFYEASGSTSACYQDSVGFSRNHYRPMGCGDSRYVRKVVACARPRLWTEAGRLVARVGFEPTVTGV